MVVRLLPRDIYLDTSIVVAAIVPGTPNARVSRDFFQGLLERNTRIHFSQILRIEVAQAIRNLASRRGQLPLRTQRRYRLDEWESNEAVRRRWMTDCAHQFEEFLSQFIFEEFLSQFIEVFELPFSITIWERGIELMV